MVVALIFPRNSMAPQTLTPPAKKKFSSQEKFSLHFEPIQVDGYEKVLHITEKRVGLNAIIAIHSTVLGPALGGTRIYPYASLDQALEDVLRLAKGMTYKSALAEVGLGGGKSVIIIDPKRGKTPEILAAFGAAVETLGGEYICAEDVGCSPSDLVHVHSETRYVVGLEHKKSSGNPSHFTAWGVFRGIQSGARKLFGSDSLEGKKVAVQGIGSVGALLVEHLFWAGAELILSDVDMKKVEPLLAKYDARGALPTEILSTPCDIFVPCALGAILNDTSIPQLRCQAVIGAANNQLAKDAHAEALRKKSILYAPDFVVNAGGLLNVAAELEEEGYRPSAPRYKVHHIYDTLTAIYEISDRNQESTHKAAIALADYRIQYGIGKRTAPLTFHHS